MSVEVTHDGPGQATNNTTINQGQPLKGDAVSGVFDQPQQQAHYSSKVPQAPASFAFMDAIIRNSVNDRLSPEAREYVDGIKLLIEKNKNAVAFKILPKSNTYVFYNNDKGVAISFSELHSVVGTHPDAIWNPASDKLPVSLQELQAEIPALSLVDSVIISPADYTRVEQMYHRICTLVNYEDYAPITTLADMHSQNAVYRINSNIDAVKRFHDIYSVHSVREPAQLGYVFEVGVSTNHYGRMDNVQWNPIFAVSGRMVFNANPPIVMHGGRRESFTPIVFMSEVNSVIPTPSLTPLIIGVSGHAFLDANRSRGSRMWSGLFRDLTGTNAYNLGRLMLNDNGEPCTVDKQSTVNEMLWETITDTILGIDIKEGRASIPFIDAIIQGTNTEHNAKLTSLTNRYFGEALNNGSPIVFAPMNLIKPEYTGVYEAERNTWASTDNINYFDCTFGGVEYEKARQFLHSGAFGPADRLKVIADLGYMNVKSLYKTYRCIFNAELIYDFMSRLSTLNVISDNIEGVEYQRSYLNLYDVSNGYSTANFTPLVSPRSNTFGVYANNYNPHSGY